MIQDFWSISTSASTSPQAMSYPLYHPDGTPVVYYMNSQSAQYITAPNHDDSASYSPYYDPAQLQYYYPAPDYSEQMYGQMPTMVPGSQPPPMSSTSSSSTRSNDVPLLSDAPQGATGLDLLRDPLPGCHPGYSIKVLMEYAIRGSPTGRLSLSEIYEAVERRFPILRTEVGANWRNSARHDISLDPRFIKSARLDSEPGKGHMWTFDPSVQPKPSKPRKKKEGSGSSDIIPPAGTSGMGRFRLN